MGCLPCCCDNPLKVVPQDRPSSRDAHDVLRVGNDLHYLVAIRSQVLVATEVHVSEPQDMPEFVRQHVGREVVRAQGNTASGNHMRGVRTGREHPATRWKVGHVRPQVDRFALAGRGLLSIELRCGDRGDGDGQPQSRDAAYGGVSGGRLAFTGDASGVESV